jgi:hypothetical protein
VLPAVLAVALIAVVASCSPDDSKSGGATATGSRPAKTSASPTASRPPKATASPTPSLPAPADGTNRRACADGSCEIRVTKPVSVPLPARFGLGSLEVTAVDDRTVTMVATLTQSEFSSDGGCGATFTGPSADSPGFATMTCHSGEKVALNKMGLTVVGVLDHAAVLRIRPTA